MVRVRQAIDIYLLSMKYWLQGDSWRDAKIFANRIVKGFKK